MVHYVENVKNAKLLHTRRTTTSLEYEIDGTSTVDIHKVNVSGTFFRENFGCWYKRRSLVPRNLNTEDGFCGMSADQ
jgi:hypothetical protein